ncbi:putative cytosol aminopeptidase [Ktedonobacteria bacterium brp13]|nr:putative cytosol aminopeptidase [Ktedonobacteria bacterium brp13]
MEINQTTQDIQQAQGDAIIIGAAKKEGSITLSQAGTAVEKALDGLINECYTQGEFKANLGEILTLHSAGKLAAKRVIVVGLGKQEALTSQSIRRATEIASRHLQKTGAQHLILSTGFATESGHFDAFQEAQVTIEGALLGLYTFRKYQNSSKEANKVTTLTLLTTEEQKSDFAHASERGQILAEASNFTRTLINEPPNVLYPIELANRAQAMAQEFGLECEIFEEEKIRELGMGGVLAVTKGSVKPPRFIILRYHGGKDGEKDLALVGKGITFDTGGISIKPAAGMDAMKGDMGGAATVLGAMQAIARLKPAINVSAFVPTCENMPGGNSYLPGDIVRILNGKTIEIVNTDAEGRLILADALSYASQEGHTRILDFATLTGAMVVALGHTMTGIFSNDEQLADEIITAGRVAGEKYWPMPLDEEYADYIKSDIADIKQTGGRAAGSVTAAKILENFVGNAKWTHLDIAGTSDYESVKAHQEVGGTGVGVRMVAALAEHYAGH